ncbi:MAG TPA: HEAT repeat domain-containing protein [bacterium]|nr:HEAT repeat domain-containing protein [bacterium]
MDSNLRKRIEQAGNPADAGLRREAIIALGYERDPAVYITLLDQINDPSAGIQHAAIISLGRFGNPEAIKELAKPKILRSPSVDVRWAAVEAIGKLGDYRIIDHLVSAVVDEAWIVRNQAVTQLKAIVRDITREREKKSAHMLIRLLAMKDREIVDLAIDGLHELGTISIDLLLEGLKSISSRIRENAAATLGRMQVDAAVPLLIPLLSDKNEYVRRSAVQSLGEIRDISAIEPLVHCLSDNVEKVQKEAIDSLVAFGRQSTAPLLNVLTHEPNKFVIRAILYTLGEIQDPAAIPALVRQLGSSYFVIRNTATRALVRYGPQVTSPLISNLSVNQSGIRPLVRAATTEDNLLGRIRAIRALGALEEHRAVKTLKKLRVSGDAAIASEAEKSLAAIGTAAWRRCSSLVVLRELGDPAVLPHFIRALADSSSNVRLEAIRSLGRFGGKEAVAALIRVAEKDKDPYVRMEAVRLLRLCGAGHTAVPDLALKSLKDKDRNVRRHAAALLGLFHDDRSVEPLISAMTDRHWGVREAAEISLLNLGERTVDALLHALQNKSWTLRFRAVRLLGELGDPAAIDPLRKISVRAGERHDIRRIAREAIGKLSRHSVPA